jgi:hypothetical protein
VPVGVVDSPPPRPAKLTETEEAATIVCAIGPSTSPDPSARGAFRGLAGQASRPSGLRTDKFRPLTNYYR